MILRCRSRPACFHRSNDYCYLNAVSSWRKANLWKLFFPGILTGIPGTSIMMIAGQRRLSKLVRPASTLCHDKASHLRIPYPGAKKFVQTHETLLIEHGNITTQPWTGTSLSTTARVDQPSAGTRSLGIVTHHRHSLQCSQPSSSWVSLSRRRPRSSSI